MHELSVPTRIDRGDTARMIAANVRQTFAAHLPLYLSSIIFTAITVVLASLFHISIDIGSSVFFLAMAFGGLLVTASLMALAGLIKLARNGFPDSPTRILGGELLRWLLKGDRAGNIAHTLVTFTILEFSFTTLKEAIPIIHPFQWDQNFMQDGLILGFGHSPWQLLQPILGYPIVTAGLNFIYDGWFCVMFGCFFWQAFSAQSSKVRMQFLLSFAFAWFIAGNLLALVFSSAGPCFYGYLHPGANPYAAQLAYLRATNAHWPIWSVDVQNMLWRTYSQGHGALGGISAMPSMHVTIAALLAIWGWHVNRKIGWLLSLFAGLIFVGSIHLAWHYAMDGIVGLLLAPLFWRLAGRVLTEKSDSALPAHQSAPEDR